MKHVRLCLDPGEYASDVHPMFDVLVNASYIDRATNLHWNFTGEGFGVIHYVEGDIDKFQEEIESIPTVAEYELTPAGENTFYAYVRDTTNEPLRQTFEVVFRDPVVIISPAEFTEKSMVTFSVFGPSREIQTAIDRLDDALGIEITEVTGMDGAPGLVESLLSDRQREAVDTAVSLGYYDIPRQASHEDVASEIGCAPSTAAEHLRKAESKLLRSMLGE